MTPELCAAYVRSLAAKPTPTLIPYYYVEDKQFCYGGSTFDFGPKAKVTSLTGAKACTATCAGYMPTKKATVSVTPTGTAKCGGHGMFNLYAATTLPFAPAITKAA
ncbi:hypothetical protein QBC46DRAFT_432675 [Diplogelasinospora grovesii]|uniref:WSC domain-containing protein n=1 Tax=Diplogelasinospora grovesii TaxID=303347 RepID=A0AAN6N8H1_9PEZI|nr:hypothetical protein QBC46DRAFT_432675 [Diplogelasinospora grovesii]